MECILEKMCLGFKAHLTWRNMKVMRVCVRVYVRHVLVARAGTTIPR